MGEPAAKQPGTRSDRGECEAGEVDQRQHAEKRPAGCANPGAAGAVRSGVAAADPASQREGARGPDASAGEGGAGGYAYRVGEHSAWHGQSDGRAIAGLRCRSDGSGENARAAGNAGGGTEATTGNSGSVDQTDQSQRSEAGAAGRKRLSGNRIAAPGEWSRKFDLADFCVDDRRSNFLLHSPGAGSLISLTFVLTIEDPNRFRKSRDVGCYVGLRPRRSESGESRPQLGISKEGDVYLRKLLVQGAHCILSQKSPDTDLKRWGLKLAGKGNKNAKKRALVAVARKLAILLHHLWVNGEVYEPLRNSRPLEPKAAA